MNEIIEINGDESILPIFSDPNFLFSQLFGATTVKSDGKTFSAEIPLSKLLGGNSVVFYGNIYSSPSSVIYAFHVAGFEGNKGGRITINAVEGKIRISLELDIPLGFLNERAIKSRIERFKKNADEIIRLERIRRKI